MRPDPTHLSLAVRDAVRSAPGTLRALAREAGVSHTTLVRIGKGEIEASPALAASLAEALERWGEMCKRHGFRVRQELYRAEREGRTAYSPLRGGHAPPSLRDAFTRRLEAGPAGTPGAPGAHRWSLDDRVEVEGRSETVEWLLGQLWNCTDVLPSRACETLSIPPGSTYARAVRTLKRSLRGRGARRTVSPTAILHGQAGPGPGPPAARLREPRVRRHPESSISRLAVGEDEVHVWSLPLKAEEAVFRRLGACLSDDERQRIARLRFAGLRRTRALSRGALRHLLAAYVGLPAGRLRLRDGPFGKPELEPPARANSEAGIGFNLSHSGELMLIAVARARRVGVDVEEVRSIDQAERIAARYFCPSEWAAIRDAPTERRTAAFIDVWTRKEAVAKAMGEGIVRLLRRIEVTAAPAEAAGLLTIDGDAEAAADWSLFPLRPAAGYTGALAVEGRRWRVRAWSAELRQLLPAAER